MFRRRISIHALPAVIVTALSLAVPFLTAGGDVVGTAGSVTARAAQSGDTDGARRFPVGSPAMEAAKAAAVGFWGAQPCGGNYTLTWTPLDVGTNATASWRNPSDAWNNAGENFDCKIDINPSADFDYPKLCTVLTHEIGHLLGRQHEAQGGQLMSAFYSAPIDACLSSDPAPAVPASEPVAETTDGLDIVATDEPRRTLRKKTTKSTKKVKRCVVRKSKRTGKRIKVCRMVKAKKASTKAPSKRR